MLIQTQDDTSHTKSRVFKLFLFTNLKYTVVGTRKACIHRSHFSVQNQLQHYVRSLCLYTEIVISITYTGT